MPALTLVETIEGALYEIERAEHPNTRHDEPTKRGTRLVYSGWIADASVEGSAQEMREIATAIRRRSKVTFKRAAVLVESNRCRVRFWSPRNSREDGLCSLAEADALADEIDAKLGKVAP